MHGGEAHVHEKQPEEQSGKSLGVSSVADPHGLLHGEETRLGEAPSTDEKDYHKWLKNGKKEEAEEKTFLGFSFPFVSDSFLDDIELMKRRWMSTFWGSDEDDVAYEEDRSQEKQGSTNVERPDVGNKKHDEG